MTTDGSVVADAAHTVLVDTAPSGVGDITVDKVRTPTDPFKSDTATASVDGGTLNRAILSSSVSQVQRTPVVKEKVQFTNDGTLINEDIFNCTQIENINRTKSKTIAISEKRQYNHDASGNTDCASLGQIAAYPKRIMSNTTQSVLIVHNQSYFLSDQGKASKFVLPSPGDRLVVEGTDNINVLMGQQRAPNEIEYPQIGDDIMNQMNKDTYLPGDDHSTSFTLKHTTHIQNNIYVKQFNLAEILIPYCSEAASCLDRCHGDSDEDYDAEGQFYQKTTKPRATTSVPRRAMSRILSDFTGAKVNLSSTSFLDVCPKERSSTLCNCDRECIIYGDCCPDVFHACWSLSASEAVESFIQETNNLLLIGPNQGDGIMELRQDTDNPEKILNHLYVNFGSCQLKDLIYYRRMMFVSRCPDMTSASLKQSCEEPDETQTPPVTASFGRVHIAFINRFCAECHGVSQDEYTIWSTSLICDPSLSAASWKILVIYEIDILLKYNLCNVSFTDRLMACQRRSCRDFQKLTLKQDQQLRARADSGVCKQVDAFLCRSYYFQTRTYRNPHCQKCLQHGNRRKREVTTAKSHVVSLDPCPIYPQSTYSPGGIFLILDVSDSSIKYNRPDPLSASKPDLAHCPTSDVFDPVSQTCKPLLCPVGQISEQGKCDSSKTRRKALKENPQLPQTRLSVSAWAHSNNISCQLFTSDRLDTEFPGLFFEGIDIHVYGLQKELTETVHEGNNTLINQSTCVELDWKYPTHNDTLVEIKLTLNEDIDLKAWQALGQFAEAIFPFDYHVAIFINQVYDQYMCASRTEPNNFSSFTIEEEGGILQARITVEERDVHYPLAYVAYKRSFVKAGNEVENSSESISVCEATKLFLRDDCSVVSFSLNETSLNISQIRRQYGEANVDAQGSQVFVCLQQKLSSAADRNVKLFHILSWAMAAASMLFLTIMLILYSLLPELLTLPGKMTASLAATMLLSFLSNSLTLVKIHHPYVCPVAAAASHVIVLAQFGWMSAIAFNMAMTFGPRKLNWVKSLYGKSFIKYNIIVWGVSSLLVLTSFILDMLHKDPTEEEDSNTCNITSGQTESNTSTTACSKLPKVQQFPSYGYPFCTWFSGPVWVKLTFVVVPYAVSYFINVVCFTITLYGIHKSNKLAQKIGRRSQQRVQCIIYIKLSTAMGFSYVLSLAKNGANISTALSYFFMALILLQGVFLFLAFMANRRLVSVLRKRFIDKEKSVKSVTTLTTRG